MTACPQCGATVTAPAGQTDRKRYCSDTCRKAAWRRRHRRSTLAGSSVPTVTPPAVTPPARDDGSTPGTEYRCPTCHTPLAIIAVIIPAAAAHVTPPEAVHMNPI